MEVAPRYELLTLLTLLTLPSLPTLLTLLILLSLFSSAIDSSNALLLGHFVISVVTLPVILMEDTRSLALWCLDHYPPTLSNHNIHQCHHIGVSTWIVMERK